jgi:type II secretory pathway component PulF
MINLVMINTPKAVATETRKALRKLPNLESALNNLSSLKGVGTTMATGMGEFFSIFVFVLVILVLVGSLTIVYVVYEGNDLFHNNETVGINQKHFYEILFTLNRLC